MPTFHQLGQVPRKRHTIFRQPDGTLYTEELIGNHGFVGPSSLLYHLRPPTRVLNVRHLRDLAWVADPDKAFRHRHFKTGKFGPVQSPTLDLIPILFNHDVALSVGEPRAEDDFFYRNAQADLLVFVHTGAGVLATPLGEMDFSSGDYLVIPRGILHQYRFTEQPVRLLVLESTGALRTPKRYRNEFGQLLESAPYSERDIRRPHRLQPQDATGEFRLIVKKDNRLTEIMVDHHPFDVVGWDGFYYPWALNIHDFEPRVGRFHLPPPTHQTFEGDNFVVCSFCPRPFDFDPQSIPAPYNHSNVMSDEVLYYAGSEFMSRKGVEPGSVTLHPDGIPHGPHPGLTEASIGQKETRELAVMVDTFHPLHVSQECLAVEDRNYYRSWLGESGMKLEDGGR
ncbi:MAG: homogentisate 1,2-dioxygenase [Terriglobales bacterium]